MTAVFFFWQEQLACSPSRPRSGNKGSVLGMTCREPLFLALWSVLAANNTRLCVVCRSIDPCPSKHHSSSRKLLTKKNKYSSSHTQTGSKRAGEEGDAGKKMMYLLYPYSGSKWQKKGRGERERERERENTQSSFSVQMGFLSLALCRVSLLPFTPCTRPSGLRGQVALSISSFFSVANNTIVSRGHIYAVAEPWLLGTPGDCVIGRFLRVLLFFLFLTVPVSFFKRGRGVTLDCFRPG